MTAMRGVKEGVHKMLVTLLILLAACGPTPNGSPRVEPAAAPDDGPASESPLARDYEFEPYPGSRWYAPDGSVVPDRSNVINAITGPDHCEWQAGVMMHLGWPPGHDAKHSGEARQYLRDPEGVFPQYALMTPYDGAASLPDGAEYTGYRTDFMELWLDPDDHKAAYLVFADHVERWPRTSDTIACG